MKLEITKKELEFDEEIKRNVDIVCKFCHTKAKYVNGSIRTIDSDYCQITTKFMLFLMI